MPPRPTPRAKPTAPRLLNITIALDANGEARCLSLIAGEAWHDEPAAGDQTVPKQLRAPAAERGIGDNQGPPLAPNPPAAMMTVKQVCAALPCSPATFWRRKGDFDLRKFGNRTLITRASFDRVVADLPPLSPKS